MTPNLLTLTNFVGIKAGLGLDTLTIDIDKIADGGSLVLLKGANGKGKSTLLDNMHPYRLMPSRAGSYSPGSFSYYDQTTGAAEKILEWTHDDIRYRSILKIKQTGKTKKTDAYLQVMSDDDWQQYGMPDGTTSDGKTVTYDACIEHILGTPEMYFTSVFSSQNKQHLSSYTNANIKALMAELLNLDHILDLGSKANEVVKLLSAEYNGLKQGYSVVQANISRVESYQGELDRVEDEIAQNKSDLLVAAANLNDAESDLKKAMDLSADAAAAENKRKELSESIKKLIFNREQAKVDIDKDIQHERKRKQDYALRHGDTMLDLKRRINLATDKITECNQLLDRSEEIVSAVDRVEELQKRLVTAEEYGTLVREKEKNYHLIKGKLSDVQGKKKEADSIIRQLDEKGCDLRTRAGLTGEVPCAGMPMQAQCKLLMQANLAAESLPEIDAQLKSIKTEKLSVDISLDQLEAQITQINYSPDDVQKAIEDYRKIQHELGNMKALAAQKTALDRAATEKEAALREISSLEDGVKENVAEFDKFNIDIDARIQTLHERIIEAINKADAEIAVLQKELDLIPENDLSALQKAETTHKARSAEYKMLSNSEITLRERRAAIDERIKALSSEIEDSKKTASLIEKYEDAIQSWSVMSKALNKDGIVALCIDDAGPTLSSITNDLLMSCYGPRFTVSIETQAQSMSGAAKETFDIRVIDGDTDEDKSVRAMSGGERIYINEAMTRAIALYQAQQTGKQYGTLFSDESDGALDPERKIMFTNMKRKVLEIGGYEREIFITHTPDLYDLADAVIDLDAM